MPEWSIGDGVKPALFLSRLNAILQSGITAAEYSGNPWGSGGIGKRTTLLMWPTPGSMPGEAVITFQNVAQMAERTVRGGEVGGS